MGQLFDPDVITILKTVGIILLLLPWTPLVALGAYVYYVLDERKKKRGVKSRTD